MSWNIQEGGGGRLDAIAALIRGHKPDCVALPEVDSLRNAEALASELRMADLWRSKLPVGGGLADSSATGQS